MKEKRSNIATLVRWGWRNVGMCPQALAYQERVMHSRDDGKCEGSAQE
jgi:hypothetical protein